MRAFPIVTDCLACPDELTETASGLETLGYLGIEERAPLAGAFDLGNYYYEIDERPQD